MTKTSIQEDKIEVLSNYNNQRVSKCRAIWCDQYSFQSAASSIPTDNILAFTLTHAHILAVWTVLGNIQGLSDYLSEQVLRKHH